MPRPGTYDMQIVEEDTWRGFPRIEILLGAYPPADALASVRIQFRESPTSANYSHQLTSADIAEIEILDADAWLFTVKPVTLTLGWGLWHYSVECTDAAGNIYTYLGGKFRINRDATR